MKRFSSQFNKQGEQQNEDQWIISYADMISSILVVLMLMFSFTKLDLVKIDSFQRANGQQEKIQSLQVLAQQIEQTSVQQGLQNELKIDLDEDGLKIHFQNVAWFDSGNANIKDKSLSNLDPIFKIIAQASIHRLIDIEGHTDDVLGAKARKTLNWELASERALALFKHLKLIGVNDRAVRLIAYADTKPFFPIIGLKGNDLLEARKQNRRVSIFIGEVR